MSEAALWRVKAVDAVEATSAKGSQSGRCLKAFQNAAENTAAGFCLCRKKERRRKFHYIYIPPILSFTIQDSQPPWGSEVSVICHVLLYCILLAYIVKHCIKEKVLKGSPAN